MRLDDRYDVICSGGGLSNYLCAALLGKAGRKVLVIDEPDFVRPKQFGDGFVFDPDYVLLNRLEPSGALGKSLAELGLLEGLTVEKQQASDAITQILAPEYRVNFFNDGPRTAQELKREIRAADESMLAFIDKAFCAGTEVRSFVEDGFRFGQASGSEAAKWKAFWGSYYSKMRRERPVPFRELLPESSADTCESVVSAVLGSQTYSAPFNIGCEQACRGLAVTLSGQHRFHQSSSQVLKKIEDVIVANGGAVKHNGRVESLVTKGDKIAGVLLSSYEGIVRSDIIVLGNRLRRLYLTLPLELRDAALLRGLSRVEPSHWRFTIAVALRRDVIPTGATDSMVAVGSYQYPLEEENYVHIQILPEGLSGGEKGADIATLLVTALVPYRASAMDYYYLRRLAGKMMHVVADVMPFADKNIISIYPDFRQGEADLRAAYPFHGAEWISENLFQYYVRGDRLAQDFWGPSWATSHRNLYLAGRAVWPSLGAYGEALAARKVYEDIIKPEEDKT